MSGHTPGPWEYDDCDLRVYSDANGAAIADIICGNRDDGSALPEKEVERNMALISAAPDLLSALKELSQYDKGSSSPGDFGYDILQRCKAAIAKAEGSAR